MIDGALSTHFQTYLPHWHWVRIENSGLGRGVPDMNGCHRSIEVWLELKRTEAWAVDLTPEQTAWAERRARAGGRVFFAIRRHCAVGPRRPAADALYLYGAHQGRQLRAAGLKAEIEPLGFWPGPQPSRWDWVAVEKILLASTCYA